MAKLDAREWNQVLGYMERTVTDLGRLARYLSAEDCEAEAVRTEAIARALLGVHRLLSRPGHRAGDRVTAISSGYGLPRTERHGRIADAATLTRAACPTSSWPGT